MSSTVVRISLRIYWNIYEEPTR